MHDTYRARWLADDLLAAQDGATLQRKTAALALVVGGYDAEARLVDLDRLPWLVAAIVVDERLAPAHEVRVEVLDLEVVDSRDLGELGDAGHPDDAPRGHDVVAGVERAGRGPSPSRDEERVLGRDLDRLARRRRDRLDSDQRAAFGSLGREHRTWSGLAGRRIEREDHVAGNQRLDRAMRSAGDRDGRPAREAVAVAAAAEAIANHPRAGGQAGELGVGGGPALDRLRPATSSLAERGDAFAFALRAAAHRGAEDQDARHHRGGDRREHRRVLDVGGPSGGRSAANGGHTDRQCSPRAPRFKRLNIKT